jgi:hypothetical protein|tara:strand:- start:266 stop:535 length:270 start_codon:yes stop_codon:yes gene_type:complete
MASDAMRIVELTTHQREGNSMYDDDESPKGIIVELKSNYGREVIYPACTESRLFAKIADTTTLTKQTIALIQELGYTVHIKPQTLGEML